MLTSQEQGGEIKTSCSLSNHFVTKLEKEIKFLKPIRQFFSTCLHTFDKKSENISLEITSSHCLRLMPYPCSHFYFDIKFGNRLYSNEKRRTWPLLF